MRLDMVRRAIAIIRLLELAEREYTLNDLAERLDVHQGTVRRYLDAVMECATVVTRFDEPFGRCLYVGIVWENEPRHPARAKRRS